MSSLQPGAPLSWWQLVPWLAGASGIAVALLGPLAFDAVAYDRTRFSIWVALLLVTPAVMLFAYRIGHADLGQDWRAWWTVALATYLVHIWYGFGVMFAWSISATFEAQGIFVASSNFLLAGLWAVSVTAAWFGIAANWLHGAATLLLCIGALTSTIIFGRFPSPWFGVVVACGLLAATLARLLRKKITAP